MLEAEMDPTRVTQAVRRINKGVANILTGFQSCDAFFRADRLESAESEGEEGG